ncbi:MAG: class I SAM-dependent methyltransferase [Candidatus Omnitrophota bacterium]
MANFPPLKSYIIYCLGRLIKEYALTGPFLDAGCGSGDISRYAALRGWRGKAVDPSPAAFKAARKTLGAFSGVTVENKGLADVSGVFNTVFLMDVLEHIEDDAKALEKISSLLSEGGHLVISVPVNPREWRWDDEFYGHYRRYTVDGIRAELERSGFSPVVFWDFTFPVFWFMRRMYTRLKKPAVKASLEKESLTAQSSRVNAYEMPLLPRLLSSPGFLWKAVYALQFRFFRSYPRRGHEIIILSVKKSAQGEV